MPDLTASIEAVEQPLDQDTCDAICALWKSEGAEIDDLEERLSQIAFVAYAGGDLVGITSAQLIREQHTQQHLYSLRALVRKDWQQQPLAYNLLAHNIEVKGDAFSDGSDLTAIGVLVEVEAAFAIDKTTFPSHREYQFPVNKTPKTFYFIGFDQRGIGEYVHYFPGAKIMGMPKRPPSINPQSAVPTPELKQELVRDTLSAAQQEELITLWLEAGVLSSRKDCLARIPQVAALAYSSTGAIVGVGSVFPTVVPHLKVKLLGYRSFISPGVRGGQTATELLNLIFEDQNSRFANGDSATPLPGMVYLLQNAQLNASVVDAVSPRSGFVLAGFDKQGRQIRARYFDDAMLTLSE